jgi:hypothetical protein
MKLQKNLTLFSVNLQEILKEVVQELSPLADEKKLTISYQSEEMLMVKL